MNACDETRVPIVQTADLNAAPRTAEAVVAGVRSIEGGRSATVRLLDANLPALDTIYARVEREVRS